MSQDRVTRGARRVQDGSRDIGEDEAKVGMGSIWFNWARMGPRNGLIWDPDGPI